MLFLLKRCVAQAELSSSFAIAIALFFVVVFGGKKMNTERERKKEIYVNVF